MKCAFFMCVKKRTAYELRISDWSSDVCSSDLQLAGMSAPYKDAKPPERLASVNKAVATVRAAVPDASVSFIAWPGTEFSTKHHYMVALAGDRKSTRLNSSH